MIAAALKNAARFKQVSLPALWSIVQSKETDERTRLHASRVVWEICRADTDKEGLRRLLVEKGMADVAKSLDNRP